MTNNDSDRSQQQISQGEVTESNADDAGQRRRMALLIVGLVLALMGLWLFATVSGQQCRLWLRYRFGIEVEDLEGVVARSSAKDFFGCRLLADLASLDYDLAVKTPELGRARRDAIDKLANALAKNPDSKIPTADLIHFLSLDDAKLPIGALFALKNRQAKYLNQVDFFELYSRFKFRQHDCLKLLSKVSKTRVIKCCFETINNSQSTVHIHFALVCLRDRGGKGEIER